MVYSTCCGLWMAPKTDFRLQLTFTARCMKPNTPDFIPKMCDPVGPEHNKRSDMCMQITQLPNPAIFFPNAHAAVSSSFFFFHLILLLIGN